MMEETCHAWWSLDITPLTTTLLKEYSPGLTNDAIKECMLIFLMLGLTMNCENNKRVKQVYEEKLMLLAKILYTKIKNIAKAIQNTRLNDTSSNQQQ